MHTLEMILKVIASRKLLSKARAVGIQTSPIETRNLVHRFLMSFSIVWSCESFGARAIIESATIHLLVLLLVLPTTQITISVFYSLSKRQPSGAVLT